MAVGDVTCEIVTAETSAVDTSLTALRAANLASGAYIMTPIMNGQKVLITAISGV